MTKLALLATLIFSVMFSSASFAEWKEVGLDRNGDRFYVDLERIRKHDGYVYSWDLSDYLKPDKNGYLSTKMYKQGDCKLFRYKVLSFYFHKQPMGGDTGESYNPKNPEWEYPPPNSNVETVLKTVCDHVK